MKICARRPCIVHLYLGTLNIGMAPSQYIRRASLLYTEYCAGSEVRLYHSFDRIRFGIRTLYNTLVDSACKDARLPTGYWYISSSQFI